MSRNDNAFKDEGWVSQRCSQVGPMQMQWRLSREGPFHWRFLASVSRDLYCVSIVFLLICSFMFFPMYCVSPCIRWPYICIHSAHWLSYCGNPGGCLATFQSWCTAKLCSKLSSPTSPLLSHAAVNIRRPTIDGGNTKHRLSYLGCLAFQSPTDAA